jgi:hypothetical protein
MLSFFDSWKPFDVNKVKPYLKMAVQRIQIATNKKTAAVKYVVGWQGEGWLETGKGKAHLHMLMPLPASLCTRLYDTTNRVAQREVASLLAQQKDEKAAIKVEAIIRYVLSFVELYAPQPSLFLPLTRHKLSLTISFAHLTLTPTTNQQ